MNFLQSNEVATFLQDLKMGIWFLGITAWLFGICDRSIASLADGYLSATDLLQLFTASFFLVCWLFLKPNQSVKSES
jgi:hypothetical protein